MTYHIEDIETIDGVSTPKRDKRIPPLSLSSPEKSPDDIFETVSPAVVSITKKTIRGEEYSGSGFIIANDGEVITNHHLIRSAQEINIKLKDGRIYSKVPIIYHDENRDVCL